MDPALGKVGVRIEWATRRWSCRLQGSPRGCEAASVATACTRLLAEAVIYMGQIRAVLDHRRLGKAKNVDIALDVLINNIITISHSIVVESKLRSPAVLA
jgi:hypothetical protein